MWDAQATETLGVFREKVVEVAQTYREKSFEQIQADHRQLSQTIFTLEQYPDMPLPQRYEAQYLLAHAYMHIAYRYRELDETHFEEVTLRHATDHLVKIPADSLLERDLLLMQSYGERGNMYRALDSPTAAIEMYTYSVQIGQEALEKYQRLPSQPPLVNNTARCLIVMLNNLGMEYDVLGERDEALLYCRRALSLAQQTDAPSAMLATIAENITSIESAAVAEPSEPSEPPQQSTAPSPTEQFHAAIYGDNLYPSSKGASFTCCECHQAQGGWYQQMYEPALGVYLCDACAKRERGAVFSFYKFPLPERKT